MIIARWYCNARFGMKEELVSRVKEWWSSIGKEIGQTDYTIATGRVGAAESLVTVDVRVKDLAELDAQWVRLADHPGHRKFGRDVEPLLVSGTTRWEILGVAE